VALDITEGKLVLLFRFTERESANQEIVHAQDQKSFTPPPPGTCPLVDFVTYYRLTAQIPT
jgi:hypothetical protein